MLPRVMHVFGKYDLFMSGFCCTNSMKLRFYRISLGISFQFNRVYKTPERKYAKNTIISPLRYTTVLTAAFVCPSKFINLLCTFLPATSLTRGIKFCRVDKIWVFQMPTASLDIKKQHNGLTLGAKPGKTYRGNTSAIVPPFGCWKAQTEVDHVDATSSIRRQTFQRWTSFRSVSRSDLYLAKFRILICFLFSSKPNFFHYFGVGTYICFKGILGFADMDNVSLFCFFFEIIITQLQ